MKIWNAVALVALLAAPESRAVADGTVIDGVGHLYFHTADRATYMCENAETAVVVNMISHGASFGDPTAESQMIDRLVNTKKCQLLLPDHNILVKTAITAYVVSMNYPYWAAEIYFPKDKSDKIKGYVPTDYISFIGRAP
ncbi:MAG: hypothetical protein M0006_02275 [Magnetospirillum sp.]|nr:hypothetical protein [Magnetospirillum sp.]